MKRTKFWKLFSLTIIITTGKRTFYLKEPINNFKLKNFDQKQEQVLFFF